MVTFFFLVFWPSLENQKITDDSHKLENVRTKKKFLSFMPVNIQIKV